MTTNQRHIDNGSVDDDDDEEKEEEVKEDDDEIDGSHSSSLRSSASSHIYTATASSLPHQPLSPPIPPTATTTTTTTTIVRATTTPVLDHGSNHHHNSVSSILPPQPPILQSVESTSSRPGAYAVAPGNRITQLATSKSLFHPSSSSNGISPPSPSEPNNNNNNNRTLSTEEIIAMLHSTRTYTDEEAMAPSPPSLLLLPSSSAPPLRLSDVTNSTPDNMMMTLNLTPHDSSGGSEVFHDETDAAEISERVWDDPISSRTAENTISHNNHDTVPRPVPPSSTPSSSSYRELSVPVPVAHLVPIPEEQNADGTPPLPMMTIVGTPYIEEQPPRNTNHHHHHPTNHHRMRRHVLKHKFHYLFFTLAVILLLSAVVFGLICGISGACSERSPDRNNSQSGTDPPLLDPRAIDMINYINNVTLSNRTIGYPPPVILDSYSDNVAAPAEELALQWLIDVDPMQLWANRTEHQFQIQQRYALRTLYAATTTNRWQWTNTSGWTLQPPQSSMDSDECQWFGVNCTVVSERSGNKNVVTSLTLSNNGLYGSIPSDLGLLSNLTRVDLSLNLLCGSLPVTIGLWQSIQHLDLHSDMETKRLCVLNGTIPSAIGNWNGPITIDWSGHALSGTLPTSMSNWNMNHILKFKMNLNRIEGTIPSFVVTWLNLTEFEMQYNDMTGTIPESIGHLRQLQVFTFPGNALNGTLPSSIQNLTNMESFSVSENRLTGTIPDGISYSWTNLRYAGFYDNDFVDGTVPEGICRNNTEEWTWVEIDCHHTAADDICSCCACL